MAPDPNSRFSLLSQVVRPQAIKLARQGCLVDECFKVFQRATFPGATPDQVHAMRTCFFAGAAELLSLMTFSIDPATDDVTEADQDLFGSIAGEIERFHERTMKAATAGQEGGHG